MNSPIINNKRRYLFDNEGKFLYKVESHLSDTREIMDEFEKTADEFKIEIEERETENGRE